MPYKPETLRKYFVFRNIFQLVECMLWEHMVVSSSLAIPTKNNNMDINEIKQQYRDSVKIELKNPYSSGGQTCGLPTYTTVLTSEELGLKIELNHFRSQLKNKQYSLLLFELLLDELVK